MQIMPNDLKKIFYIVLFTHKGCEEMISKMSRGIVEFLLKEDTIDNEDKEIYEYGFNILIYNILETMLLVGLGILIGKLILTLGFIGVFLGIRSFTGGYHAKSRIGCGLVTVTLWFGAIGISGMLGTNHMLDNVLLVLCIVLTALVIGKYAPVANEHKVVNEDKSKLSKKISLFAFSICAVVCLICMKWYTEMACMLCITLAELSMLMLIGVFIVKSDKEETYEESNQEDCSNFNQSW